MLENGEKEVKIGDSLSLLNVISAGPPDASAFNFKLSHNSASTIGTWYSWNEFEILFIAYQWTRARPIQSD